MNTRAERLLEALGGAREVWIEDAAPERTVRRRSGRHWIALAACLAVVIAAACGGTRLAEARSWAELVQNFRPLVTLDAIPGGTPAPAAAPAPTLNGLPLLTIHEGSDLGMGFEGVMVRDVSELDTGSPWTPEAEVSTLPVYRNTAYTGYMPVAPDGGAAMLALAEETAAALGTEITQVTYERVGDHAFGTTLPDDAVDGLEAETPLAEIRVIPSSSVGIFFEPSAALPDGSETSSREAAERAADLLLEQYAALHGYAEPRRMIATDYTFDGTPITELQACDGAGNLEDQILSYNFNRIWFGVIEGDELHVIWLDHGLTYAERLGDYPIIPLEEAEGLLREGHFITTIPEEESPAEGFSVAHTELVYRAGGYEETYLPYYKFWVELPRNPNTEMAEELTMYGAYYVPAVEGKYLTNMPLWNGSFN